MAYSLEDIMGDAMKPHPHASQLGWAFEVALTQHRNQKDRAGEPYMLHLVRVCMAVESDTEKTVALLHDVVEDGHLDMDHIRDYFDEYVADAVDAISKRRGEEYETYLRRVKSNKVALAVKLADVADNSREDRLARLDKFTQARFRKKYATALKILKDS